jgi:hypothetical protein
MDIKIISIAIKCHTKNIFIPIDSNIFFSYGNSGVGKTTLLNLIKYALGGSLITTNAINNSVEYVSVQLALKDRHITLERRINSNLIILQEGNSRETLHAKSSDRTMRSISDYFYRIEGVEPQRMVRGKSVDVNVTFLNFLWYSYLQQDELDNSFFYLGRGQNSLKEMASNNVLRVMLDKTEISIKEARKELNLLKEKQERIRNKITVSREIGKTSKILGLDIEEEVIKKKREILLLQDKIKKLTMKCRKEDSFDTDIDNLLELQQRVGMYLAEIRYLAEFGKIKAKIYDLETEERKISEQIIMCQKYIDSFKKDDFELNLQQLSDVFEKVLSSVGFTYLDREDTVKIDKKTFLPGMYSSDGKFKYDYYNLSSGGQKSVFKICFAIALHIYVKENDISTVLPSFLIIDTPMKNISEREDFQLYSNLYRYFLEVFGEDGILSDSQLILVDKELPALFKEAGIHCKHFSVEEPLLPAD